MEGVLKGDDNGGHFGNMVEKWTKFSTRCKGPHLRGLFAS